MPTNSELRTNHKKMLFDFLKLAKDNGGSDKVIGLYELIIGTQAIMEAEDVAYVEKMIAKLK
ncbi:MAG: hypothetical protein FWG90_04160 [Oscillospiraceae bacterium]|nr:hypothetical protein [Oscillospiraceae bacterium]